MDLAPIDHQIDAFQDFVIAGGGVKVDDLEEMWRLGHVTMVFPLPP
jgi:hypothetical protein